MLDGDDAEAGDGVRARRAKAKIEARRVRGAPKAIVPQETPYSRWLKKHREYRASSVAMNPPPELVPMLRRRSQVRVPQARPSAQPTDTDLAYAAGLIVGEGSFVGIGVADACLSMQLQTGDPQPVLFLLAIFGGHLYGPYRYRTAKDGYSRQGMWAWRLRGQALREAIPPLYRWLPPSRKREQFLAWARRCGIALPEAQDRPSGEMFIMKHVKGAESEAAHVVRAMTEPPYGWDAADLTGVAPGVFHAPKAPERSEAS